MTSLYRRHRPKTFADVVGQPEIVRTMSNAVANGKTHHAYLFVGSRGTGKTSVAKILARSLNCVNGPTLEPCGECESCTTITSSTASPTGSVVETFGKGGSITSTMAASISCGSSSARLSSPRSPTEPTMLSVSCADTTGSWETRGHVEVRR